MSESKAQDRAGNFLLDLLLQNLFRPWVPVALVVALAAYSAHWIWPAQLWKVASISVLGAVLGLLGWYLAIRVPRPQEGHVGFLVAVACDNDAEQKRFRQDFIDKLRQQLRGDEDTVRPFQVIECGRLRAESLRSDEDAAALQAKNGSQFLVYGRVKRRTDQAGEQIFVMETTCLVRHAPIPAETQAKLGSEMAQVLPTKTILPEHGSVFAFELVSEWFDLSARYIVALAAAITRDFAHAERLLLQVRKQLPTRGLRHPSLKQISARLPLHLASLYDAWLSQLWRTHHLTRDTSLVVMSEEVADKLLELDPNHYAALLAMGIAAFALRRDLGAAKNLMRRAKKAAKRQDLTWRINLAFLYGYEGRLDDAEREYRIACKGPFLESQVLIQTEEFIQLVLATEPERAALHYCSALVNLHAKDDPLAAARDLRAFLSSPSSGAYPSQRATALSILGTLPSAVRSPNSDTLFL